MACRQRQDSFFLSKVGHILQAIKCYSTTSTSQYFSMHRCVSTGEQASSSPTDAQRCHLWATPRDKKVTEICITAALGQPLGVTHQCRPSRLVYDNGRSAQVMSRDCWMRHAQLPTTRTWHSQQQTLPCPDLSRKLAFCLCFYFSTREEGF